MTRPAKLMYMDDKHVVVERTGKTADGHLFLLTRPWCYDSNYDRMEDAQLFLVLYLFDGAGELLEARIEDLGIARDAQANPRPTQKLRKEMLASLGEVTDGAIRIAPFSLERFGREFGFRGDDEEDRPRLLNDVLYHPGGDEYYLLDPDEVLLRIKPAFRHVHIDKTGGDELVRNKEAELVAARAPEMIMEAHRMNYGKTAFVTLADDETGQPRIHFLLRPDFAIVIDYDPPEQRESCLPMLQKLATLLDYDLERRDDWPGDPFADFALHNSYRFRCHKCARELFDQEEFDTSMDDFDLMLGKLARSRGWLVERTMLRTEWRVSCDVCRTEER